MKAETMLAHLGDDRQEYKGAVVPPIFQNSLFAFEGWDAIDDAFSNVHESQVYTRGNNPTALVAEKKIAALCGGEQAKLFTSGMAAISAAVMSCVSHGDHIITIKNVYGPANQFLGEYLRDKMGVSITYVDGRAVEDFEKAICARTALIYLESPASTVMYLQDLKKIASLGRSRGIKTVVDNTWATPLFQRPLTMGIDLEIHSCSKYIGGHSDVVAGVVVGPKEHMQQIFVREAAWLGGKIAPFEAWLIIRSLRTLPIRVRKHQENAMVLAEFLYNHPKVKSISYPGHKSFPQYELAKEQMRGFTGLLSFDLACENLEEIKAFVNALQYFSLGVSWGGHESLVYAPAISYTKELSPEKFKALGISMGSIRVSVGLEDVEDLKEDLEQALAYVS